MTWDEKFNVYGWLVVLAFVAGFVIGRWLHPDIDNALRTYQTLITGVLAVVAAFYVYGAANRQIKEVRVQAETDRKQAIMQENRNIARSIHVFADQVGKLSADLGVILAVYEQWKLGNDAYVETVTKKYPDFLDIVTPPDSFLASWEIMYICGMSSNITSIVSIQTRKLLAGMQREIEYPARLTSAVDEDASQVKTIRILLTVAHDYLSENAKRMSKDQSHSPQPRPLTESRLTSIAHRTDSNADAVRAAVTDWVGKLSIFEDTSNHVASQTTVDASDSAGA